MMKGHAHKRFSSGVPQGIIFLTSFLFLFAVMAKCAETDLLISGAEEVYLISPSQPEVKKWSWQASDSDNIPESFQSKFRSTDECKPYKGDLILITSSAGGVALVNRSTQHCLFLTEAKNAHSAALLPGKQVVVASSFGGDTLEFYDSTDQEQPAVALQSLKLHGAHGVIWDGQRNCLWALGEEELLKLTATKGDEDKLKWSVISRYPLPSSGGHDLSDRQDGKHLLVSSGTQVFLFNRDLGKFQQHERIGDEKKVKSVSVEPVSKKVVYHKGSEEHWWSDTIRFIDADPIILKGARLYKIRWDVPIELP